MFFTSGSFICAQASLIEGVVTDSLNSPIPYVNVFLKTSTTDRVVAFTTTKENGTYVLEVNGKGLFELNFSSISYKTKKIAITIGNNEAYTVDTVLNEENFALDEVIINSERAITVKEDTIIYRASAFKKGNEENVEDLLKNIPGINVEDDGTIKVGNKEIEKLLIEGDDLFGKGYKLLSKNLDASTVSKVEVYDKYSENRLLKGIESSDKVAINLKLTDSKNKLLGVLKPGYGLGFENRYDSKANVILLSQKSKHYVFADVNNVGFDSTSDLSLFDATQDVADISTASNTPQAISLISSFQRPRDLDKERSNFNNSEMVSINDIFTIRSKLKIKTNILLNWDEKKFFNENREVFSIEGADTFLREDTNLLRGRQLLGRGNIALTYDISSNKLFEYTGDFSTTTLEATTDLTFNNIPSFERLNEDPVTTSHNAVFTNKINTSSVFQLKGNVSYSETPQHYTTDQFVFDDLFETASMSPTIFQKSEHTLTFFKVEGEFLKRLKNKNLFKISAVTHLNQNRLTSNFQLTNETDGDVEFSNDFQNTFKYNLFNTALKTSYSHRLGPLSVNGELEVLYNNNYLKNTTTEIRDHSFIINPLLGFDLSLNRNNKLNGSVGLKSSNPSLRNVIDGYILTDFNVFSRGAPSNIEQLQSFSGFANYTLGTIISPFYSNTLLYYEKNVDYYTTDSQITSDYRLSDQFRAEGRSFVSLRTDANFFLDVIDTNLKLKGGYLNQVYQNRVNDNIRDVAINSYEFGFEVKSAFSGDFNFHLGTNWSDNKITVNEISRNLTNQSFMDIVYTPSAKINISANIERYTFNLSDNTNSFYFADIKTTYQAIKNKLSISLEGKNLLNVTNYEVFSINDLGFANSSYRLLPRFVLLKARIKI